MKKVEDSKNNNNGMLDHTGRVQTRIAEMKLGNQQWPLSKHLDHNAVITGSQD